LVIIKAQHGPFGKSYQSVGAIIAESYVYSRIYKQDARYRGGKAYIKITNWSPLNNRIDFDFTSNMDEAWISKPSDRDLLYRLHKEYLKKMGSRLILISVDVTRYCS